MNWEQFTAQPNGTRIINQSIECVAVANQYHGQVIGGSFVGVGSAHQWWTNFSSYATLTSNYVQSQTATPGAIVVWRGGRYNALHGHIGVVTGVNGNDTYNTMEQNAESNRWLYRYKRDRANLLGFLVPKNNPAGDDMPLSDQDLDKITARISWALAFNARERGGSSDGSTGRTLFEVMADLPKRVAAEVLDTPVPRGGSNLPPELAGNATTLRGVIAWYDSNVRLVLDSMKKDLIVNGVDPELIKKSIEQAFSQLGFTPENVAKVVNDEAARRLQK